MKRCLWSAVFLTFLLFPFRPAFAQSEPSCHFEPDGSIVCEIGGGEEGGEEDEGEEEGGESETCQPGDILYQYEVVSFDPATNTCTILGGYFSCGGVLIEGGELLEDVPCAPPQEPENPCDEFTVNNGGITCESFEWNVRARVTFPEIYLDVRPYPATLVRWPTAVRNGGLPESSGSGGVDYIPYGGGSPGNPLEGDWRDLRLTLTLQAAGPMFVTLPYIGELALPDQGATGNPTMIQWEVPSHPEAGGGPLAGGVTGLDELPGDMPLFVGRGRAPYRLFWELRYFVYEVRRGCIPGPDENGFYNCGNGTGHRGIVGYRWRRYSDGGEIPPTAVRGLPPSLMADINNDGVIDSYWDNNLTLRRMDDANRVDNPRYQRSWNWGGTIYWAVREGQGQIGWPGVP